MFTFYYPLMKNIPIQRKNGTTKDWNFFSPPWKNFFLLKEEKLFHVHERSSKMVDLCVNFLVKITGTRKKTLWLTLK